MDLSELERETWARHARFPCLPLGAAVRGCAECEGCEQETTAGHETVRLWRYGDPTPDAGHKVSLRRLRALQWLVWRLAVGHGLVGSDSGFLINAGRSYNFADGIPWVVVGASGYELTLEAAWAEDADPRKVLLWMGRTRPEDMPLKWVNGAGEWGVSQPGDIVQFSVPSVLAFQSRPMLKRLLEVTGKRAKWEVDRDVSHALDKVWDAPVMATTWREAGDPVRWNDSAHVWRDPSGLRCRHCRQDFSKSVGNYGAPDGVTVNDAGEHWYCAVRRYAVGEQVDTNADGIPDTWQYAWHAPTGAETFPGDGYCVQGGCDRYEAAGESEWLTRHDFGQWMQQLWGAMDIRLDMGYPGYGADPRQWKILRVEAPSIACLMGWGMPVSTPAGMHQQVAFLRTGAHGDMVVYEDDAGEHVRVREGMAWDPFGEVTRADQPDAGTLPATVDDWTKHRDPLDMEGDDLAAADDFLYHVERLGIRVLRDVGTRAGRGYARYAHAEAVERWLVLPRLRFDVVGVQDRCEAKFVRLAAPVTIGVIQYGGYVEVGPVRQAEKSEVQVCAREVASVTALGDGRFQVDLKNVRYQAGFPFGDRGARYDKIWTWWAGGGDGTPAESWAAVHNHYQGGDMGSPYGGLAAGDAVSLELEAGGQDLSTRRFVVESVAAHGGAEAANWGQEVVLRRFELGGCWDADPSNLTAGTMPDGTAIPGEVVWPELATVHARSDVDDHVGVSTQTAMAAGVVLRVVDTGELLEVTGVVYLGNQMTLGISRGYGGTTATAMDEGAVLEWVLTREDTGAALERVGVGEVELPTLGTGEWWWDEVRQRAHFAAADAGMVAEIRYVVEGQDKDESHLHVETFAVVEHAEVLLDVAWSTPGPRVLRRLPEGTALSATLVDDGGVIRVRADLALAGVRGELEIETGELAGEPPGGVALAGDYPVYAKRMDRLVFRDESGLVALAGAGVANVVLRGWWSAARCMPATATRVPEATAYGTDDWEALGVLDWLSDHGSGRRWLREAWLVGRGSEEGCLRV